MRSPFNRSAAARVCAATLVAGFGQHYAIACRIDVGSWLADSLALAAKEITEDGLPFADARSIRWEMPLFCRRQEALMNILPAIAAILDSFLGSHRHVALFAEWAASGAPTGQLFSLV